MIKIVKVKLWGTLIGIFYLDKTKGYVSFEYDKEFRSSGIEVSPIMMPLSDKVYEFPDLLNSSFKGVPGLMADSLPDKFGNAVIDQWLASQGRAVASFNVLERLCYTGKRGMGALEYEPDSSGNYDVEEEISITKMSDFASAILEKKENLMLHSKDDMNYRQLIKLGTSAGGARAKAVIAFNKKTEEFRSGQIDLDRDFEYWLVKFDGVSKNGDHNLEDEPEYTLIEYAYYLMAKKAGIEMSECIIFPDSNRNHFMTKRFDRINGDKIHMQTLGALLHIDYNLPGMCSYERAALTAKEIGCSIRDIEQLFRRMVYNVLAVNQDDHVKNISFLMDRNGDWSLSPAYDLTFAYNMENEWLKNHQMSINGKTSNITKEDIIQCGKAMDLKVSKCRKIIDEVYSSVREFEYLAQSVNIRDKTIGLIQGVLQKQDSECLDNE
jgi:serine/threonine-protein kinase HipA